MVSIIVYPSFVKFLQVQGGGRFLGFMWLELDFVFVGYMCVVVVVSCDICLRYVTKILRSKTINFGQTTIKHIFT